jgi:hypothetical protein
LKEYSEVFQGVDDESESGDTPQQDTEMSEADAVEVNTPKKRKRSDSVRIFFWIYWKIRYFFVSKCISAKKCFKKAIEEE